MIPHLVPDSSGTTVTVSGPLEHQCPHVDERDVGSVKISWRCQEMTIEFHSLTTYLASWRDVQISSEALTDRIVEDLEQLDGIEVLYVRSKWTTAGLSVEIRA